MTHGAGLPSAEGCAWGSHTFPWTPAHTLGGCVTMQGGLTRVPSAQRLDWGCLGPWWAC